MFKRRGKDKDIEQFHSKEPPDPILRKDVEMSETPGRGSAGAATLERPSTSGSEQEVESEVRERANTLDGATGGAREKAKKSSKWHRPGIVKKIYPKRLPSSTSGAEEPPQLSSEAEAAQDPSCVEVFSPDIEEECGTECREEVPVEAKCEAIEARLKLVEGEMLAQLKRQFEADLEEEKRKMFVQTQAQIEDIKQKCDLLLAKNIREKEAEITSLKAVIEAQKEESESLKAEIETQKVTIEYQKTELVNLRPKIEEQANLKEVLEIARGRLASLTQKHHEDINVQRKRAIEELKYSHQQQLQELQEGLTQQMREGTREIADLREKLRGLEEGRAGEDRLLVEMFQERDRIRQELDKKCREVQDVLLAKEELEAELQDARERLTQETESRQAMNQNWELKYKQLSDKLQDLQTEGEMRVQELERQLREKEETITVLQEEMVQKQQLSPPPPDYHTLKETCGLLERQILKLQTQIDQPLPSNVYHFSQQLSKYVDPEGESAKTMVLGSTTRPVEVDNIQPILQAMGCGPESRPRGYVIALFHAFNQAQSILLDYTKIGEVVSTFGQLDASDSGEDIEKSPYLSLNDVKVEATEGNMTDANKLEVPNMLRESQGELEKLRVENKNLLERLKVLEELERRDDEAPALGDKLKDLKTKYLALHSEKMELIANKNQLAAERDGLLEKLEERDNQLKQLRKEILARGDGPPTEHPNMERSLSVGDVQSPDDPKAEVKRLRDVLEQRETKIHNLTVQLKTFEAVAGNKALQEKEITELKERLQDAQKLTDHSELVQIYNSLRSEIAVAREDLRKSENEKSDLEVERDIWLREMDAAEDNKRDLQTQVARLRAILHFYETKYPEADPESVFESSEQKLFEQMKGEISNLRSTIVQKQAIIKNLTKCRATMDSRWARLQEEKDRLGEQVVVLIAANCRQKQKEAQLQDVEDLKDELKARKHEVAILWQNYESKLTDSEVQSKWKVKEQNYQEALQDLECKFKHQKHECKQRVTKLTVKLEDKTNELRGMTEELQEVIENAHERQRENDEYNDQLRQERDEMKMERNRFKEEREILKSEFNRVDTMYNEQKGRHKAEIEGIQKDKEQMKEEMEVMCSSLQDEVYKKQKQYEQTASDKLVLEIRVSELLSNEQQERQLSATQLHHFEMQLTKERHDKEHALARMYSEQADKVKLEERVSQLEQQLSMHSQQEAQTNLDCCVLTAVEPSQNSTFSAQGAYGSVSQVCLGGGVDCIQKRLHDILVGYGMNEGVGEEQKQAIREKFRNECALLSRMRHPNIVQFIGVHYSGSKELSLIMEFLPMSLERCIDRCNFSQFPIPLPHKLSILQDVVYGLLHLHKNFIIHRDLSAANILLTSDLRAKIADLGMSRILTPEELKRWTRLTKAPGAQYIMPPEAMGKNCQYNNKMDIFSFGIIALYLMLQEFPESSNSGLQSNNVSDHEVEIGRRIDYIRSMARFCNGSIERIIRNCLKDDPDSRPTTSQLKEDLEQLCRDYPNQHGDTLQMLQTIENQAGGHYQVRPSRQ